MSTTLFSAQLQSTGFQRKALAGSGGILEAIQNLFLAAYGADADLDPRSPDGQICGGLAEMFDDLNGIAYDTHQGLTNPSAATGQMLSGMMVLTGCPRNGASFSSATATFTGTPATVIDTTKVVQSSLDGSLWSPVATVTIGSGGTATGTLQCTVSGPPAQGTIPPDTLTIIQTPVTGWASVTNLGGLPGYNIEGDANARVRRQQSVAIASQGMTDGLQAALMRIQHVVQAVVWENTTTSVVTIGGSGNTINPNSLRVIVRVDGGSSADPAITSSSDDPVANMIYTLKGHGCGTQGAHVKYPLDAVGNAQTIKYDTAVAYPVPIQVTLIKRYNWPTDGADRIRAAITAWFAGTNATTGKPNIQISGNDRGVLSWTDVLASFINTVPGFDLVGLAFGYYDGDWGLRWTTSPASLTIPFGSFAELGTVMVPGG